MNNKISSKKILDFLITIAPLSKEYFGNISGLQIKGIDVSTHYTCKGIFVTIYFGNLNTNTSKDYSHRAYSLGFYSYFTFS